MNQVHRIWKNILEILESRLSRHSFETWLQSAQPVGIYKQTFFIEVPDHFSKEWLTNHYTPIIKLIIKDLVDEDIQPEFITTGEIPGWISS